MNLKGHVFMITYTAVCVLAVVVVLLDVLVWRP